MKYKLLLIGLLGVGFALADSVTITNGNDVSGTDLFEGASVVSATYVNSISDAGDLFGGNSSSVEPGSVLAEDDQTMRIEFNPGEISVRRIVISLTEDDTDTGDRAANSMSVYADTGSGWELVFTASPAQPYEPTYGDYAISVEALFDTAITTDKWAVEFESLVTGGNSGVRVVEVDGYATVPEPASVLMLLVGGSLIGIIRRHLSRA